MSERGAPRGETDCPRRKVSEKLIADWAEPGLAVARAAALLVYFAAFSLLNLVCDPEFDRASSEPRFLHGWPLVYLVRASQLEVSPEVYGKASVFPFDKADVLEFNLVALLINALVAGFCAYGLTLLIGKAFRESGWRLCLVTGAWVLVLCCFSRTASFFGKVIDVSMIICAAGLFFGCYAVLETVLSVFRSPADE